MRLKHKNVGNSIKWFSRSCCHRVLATTEREKELAEAKVEEGEINLGASTSKQGEGLIPEGVKKRHRAKKVRKGSYSSRARRMKSRRRLESERQVALSSSSGEDDLVEFKKWTLK